MTVPAAESIARRRLMALGDHVEQHGRDRKWKKFFNMAHWVARPKGVFGLDDEIEVNNDCGTSACLFGHGVNVPMLHKAGLRAIVKGTELGLYPVLVVQRHDAEDVVGRVGMYGALEVSDYLFGISRNRFSEIFLFGGPSFR